MHRPQRRRVATAAVVAGRPHAKTDWSTLLAHTRAIAMRYLWPDKRPGRLVSIADATTQIIEENGLCPLGPGSLARQPHAWSVEPTHPWFRRKRPSPREAAFFVGFHGKPSGLGTDETTPWLVRPRSPAWTATSAPEQEAFRCCAVSVESGPGWRLRPQAR